MRSGIVLTYLQRLFCFLMAIHVLNFSVDPPDQHVIVTASGVVREDLSVNEMESIGEWILEFVYGIDVVENDEPDEDEAITKLFIKISLPQNQRFQLLPVSSVMLAVLSAILFVSRSYLSHPQEIQSPPPQRPWPMRVACC